MSTRAGVFVYLAVACAFSWAIALALFLLSPVPPLVRTGMLSVYMFGPAIGAIAAQRFRGERVVEPLGVSLRPNSSWLVAWLGPVGYALAAGALGLLMPGVSASFDFSGLVERLAPGLDAAQLAHANAQLHVMPPAALFALLLVEALVAGLSINALAAFGEEIGWRGFLFAHPLLESWWARAFLVGAIWGLWHAPIILQGHNYPQHPVVGVFMMTLWTGLMAPAFQLIRERSASVWATAIMHGSLNAAAGLALVFARGGDDLIVGVTGLPGLLMLVPVNVLVWRARRVSAAAH